MPLPHSGGTINQLLLQQVGTKRDELLQDPSTEATGSHWVYSLLTQMFLEQDAQGEHKGTKVLVMRDIKVWTV